MAPLATPERLRIWHLIHMTAMLFLWGADGAVRCWRTLPRHYGTGRDG